jgi:hypothetical protein
VLEHHVFRHVDENSRDDGLPAEEREATVPPRWDSAAIGGRDLDFAFDTVLDPAPAKMLAELRPVFLHDPRTNRQLNDEVAGGAKQRTSAGVNVEHDTCEIQEQMPDWCEIEKR